MADIIKEDVPSFDLGLDMGTVYGNLQQVNDFLSAEEVTGNPKELEKADTPPKKKEETTPPAKAEEKPEIKATTVDDFLGGEEDEETPEKEEEESETKEEEGDETETNQFVVISEDLYKSGILTLDEGEEKVIAKTPEEFQELFVKEGQKRATAWLEGFLGSQGEDRKELFQAIFVDGVDPKTYLPVYNEVQDVTNLDVEDAGNQETIVRSYYTQLGWDKAKVDAKIEKLKSYADLEEEAKTLHPELIKAHSKKLEVQAEKSRNEIAQKAEEDNLYRGNITKVLQENLKTKSLDGIPLTEKAANQAYDFLYNKKWKTQDGQLLTDFDKFILESKRPENISSRIKIALLASNGFDFSKIEKKAVSSESNKLFSGLAQKTAKKSNKQSTVTPGNSGW